MLLPKSKDNSIEKWNNEEKSADLDVDDEPHWHPYGALYSTSTGLHRVEILEIVPVLKKVCTFNIN